MRYSGLVTVLTVVTVLCGTNSCGSSRRVTSDVSSRTSEVRVDSVVVGTMEAARDSVVERTTVTVDRKENGDTVRVSIVTERDRVRDRAVVKESKEKVVVKTDTVYIENRDSVLVKNTNVKGRDSPLLMNLKWVFWIILGLIALVILCRAKRP